ncbi:MAG: hypothetical protein AB1568_11355 [Thermodesulfobacteriota bacterium]
MDGPMNPGWYSHPQQGLIKVFIKNGQWVYVCYSTDGTRALSRPRAMDAWIWALSEARDDLIFVNEE